MFDVAYANVKDTMSQITRVISSFTRDKHVI